MTVNPEQPRIRNLFAVVSGGGSFGHDGAQSTHEQAGLMPCEELMKFEKRLNLFTYINRCIARNNPRIEWSEVANFLRWISHYVVDLKRHYVHAGVTHKAVPSQWGTFIGTPRTAHQIQPQLTRRRKLNILARVVWSIDKLLGDVEINCVDISFCKIENN